jgi:murein DD-endopeptidase MepM/ murein hydrolase activator NlpD
MFKIKDHLNSKLTIMILQNLNSKPKTVSISKKYIYLVSFVVFFLLLISIFIITRYINYVDAIANNLVLENKLEHFSKELIKNRNYLAELKNVDSDLRKVLSMKNNQKLQVTSIGGPQVIDQIIASKLETGNKNIVFSLEEFDLALNIIKQEIANQVESSKEIIKYVDKKNKEENARPSIWPTVGGYISSGYGYRIHPIKRMTFFHKGIDISNSTGKPVLATANGVVKYANWLGGYGKMIILSHGYGYTTYYAHLSKILVNVGTRVHRGDKIGLIGSTGLSTGPHLHYEVRYNKNNQNPVKYIKK